MSLLLAYSWLSLALDITQMALDAGKTGNQPSLLSLTTFPKDQSLGKSLLVAYSWLSLVLDMTQMALDV